MDPLTSSVLPESLCTGRNEERKEKVKRGKKKPTLVFIYYCECKVLNCWYLMSFFCPEQYHTVKYNLSLGEMGAAEPVPDLGQKSIDVTLRSPAADV